MLLYVKKMILGNNIDLTFSRHFHIHTWDGSEISKIKISNYKISNEEISNAILYATFRECTL